MLQLSTGGILQYAGRRLCCVLLTVPANQQYDRCNVVSYDQCCEEYKCSAGRKRIVTPDEEVTFTDPMVTSLARAFRWQKLIDEGVYSNVQELARAIGKDMAYVSRITRLTLLSPEIIHGVLTGQLDQIGVEKCKQPFPILWDEQKKFFGIE